MTPIAAAKRTPARPARPAAKAQVAITTRPVSIPAASARSGSSASARICLPILVWRRTSPMTVRTASPVSTTTSCIRPIRRPAKPTALTMSMSKLRIWLPAKN